MLETLLIVFREGMEAFLIVAIMLAYVTKTGRHNFIKPIYSGIVVALIISATTGWHVAELAQDPVWEGVLAITAGLLVASFTLYVMRTARHIRQDINSRLEQNAQKDGAMAEIGVFFFTILMVAREGMETALMLGTISADAEATSMITGAILGIACVAAIGFLWASQSQKINLRLFLQVTGVFLVLFSLHLFAYGLHELSEMNAIPLIGDDWNTEFHIWSEPIESAFFSTLTTVGLLIVPCGWLIAGYIRDKYRKPALPNAAE